MKGWLLGISLLGTLAILVITRPNQEAQLRVGFAATMEEQAALMDQLRLYQIDQDSFISEAKSLPELRRLALSSPHAEVARSANEKIAEITGCWGSQVDLVWKRSLEDAINPTKPIVLLQVFGRLDQEHCGANAEMARSVVFAEEKVVHLVQEHFELAWESVAPLSETSSSLPGILSGDIALYFCRPDGQVLDILPGLNSPEITRQAMQRFLQLYHASDRGRSWPTVKGYHDKRLAALLESPSNDPATVPELALRKEIQALHAQTTSLRAMIGQEPSEPLNIPSTPKFTYQREVHALFGKAPSLRSPAQWKDIVFESILQLPLSRPLGEPAHWEDGLVLLDR